MTSRAACGTGRTAKPVSRRRHQSIIGGAMKTVIMLLGLTLAASAGLACFGMFGSDADRPATQESCAGLQGQAKIDCENRQKP
jgi:hypothetical protein